MENKLRISVNVYPNHVQRTDKWIEVAQELYDLRLLLKHLSLREKQLVDQLKVLSNQESSKGDNFVFTKSKRAGLINYKLAQEILNIDFEPYRNDPVEMWKLEALIMPKEI